MKVLTVIGNRPQFIKAAAVSPTLRAVHETRAGITEIEGLQVLDERMVGRPGIAERPAVGKRWHPVSATLSCNTD